MPASLMMTWQGIGWDRVILRRGERNDASGLRLTWRPPPHFQPSAKAPPPSARKTPLPWVELAMKAEPKGPDPRWWTSVLFSTSARSDPTLLAGFGSTAFYVQHLPLSSASYRIYSPPLPPFGFHLLLALLTFSFQRSSLRTKPKKASLSHEKKRRRKKKNKINLSPLPK
ncbi:hypothetical protein IE53DRAFT_44150 [Violaceomyces palustris]|uniref:Uncharacterized protein n=1 Tax=Violaceomyces palustris TaxID=1673888 RepID=A0ACD0P7R0_9BASI|nr:hypothetical protein IE53DRAFT_44150 [Violaceomyces palustris]